MILKVKIFKMIKVNNLTIANFMKKLILQVLNGTQIKIVNSHNRLLNWKVQLLKLKALNLTPKCNQGIVF